MIFLGDTDNKSYFYDGGDDLVFIFDNDLQTSVLYGSITKFITERPRLAYSRAGSLVIDVRLTGNESYDCRQAARVIEMAVKL